MMEQNSSAMPPPSQGSGIFAGAIPYKQMEPEQELVGTGQ